ncbi:MFS transporter [Candidatus Darwinibacter acetoxidans]|nr:MFS transporter [Bacillota bacterium]HOB40922.1 MFS transporter [Limnochordia bacterium]HOK32075.1 MFS transporter [Limnochordia bacterium]HOM00781.1 MFS transporter [Limnochordia bacterium]HOQ74522.1 MFS transporter [Limnochordia bacterium]
MVFPVTKRVRKAMKLNTVEGAFAVAAENLAAPYLGLFALGLGATPSQIGMLTAFPNLIGNLLQIPAGLWSERMKDKRILPIVGGYLARSTWALLAIVPFLVPPQYRVGVVILLATFRILAANIGVPAWTALQAELIPRAIRGRYYANRNIVCNISAVAATVLATVLLTLRFPLNFQLIFGGAAALGLTATYIFSTIEFAQSPPKPRQGISFRAKVQAFWGEVRTQKDFRSYVRSSLIWNFGVNLASSLFVVYFVEDLGGAAGFWAVFSGVNLATQVLVQRYWGRLADVFGQKNVMLASGIGAVFLPLLWWGTRSTWFPLIIYIINGVAWGGYNLGAFNLLLEITPDDNRTVYVGAYNTLMGLAMAAGPLVGGFAAESFGLRPVFLASSLFRALGLYVFYRSVEDAAQRPMGLKDLLPRGRQKQRRLPGV